MIDSVVDGLRSGSWVLVAAAVLWLALAAWKRVQPRLWSRIPDGWRWIVPLLVAAIGAGVEIVLAGGEVTSAAVHAVLAALAAMGLQGGVKEAQSGRGPLSKIGE